MQSALSRRQISSYSDTRKSTAGRHTGKTVVCLTIRMINVDR
jgi:hypothetical protein